MKDTIVNIQDKGDNVLNWEAVRSECSAGNGESFLDYAVETKRALKARFAYGFIFFLANLLAWIVRDYGDPITAKLHYLRECRTGKECLHTEGVLRVSFGCFIFFFCMFFTTFRARKLHHISNLWHSGWWFPKFVIWISFMLIPFFIPSGLIQIYGEVARLGAGCFMGLFMATVSYVASLCGIFLMYLWFAGGSSSLLNIFFITWTLVLLKVMLIVSLNSKVNKGLLSSGIMGSYIVFLCWSAIRSEPTDERPIRRKQDDWNGDWTAIVSSLFAVCAIVMATFSTGIDSKTFQFRKDEVQMEDDVPYRYGFFHIIFSMGAMYFAMLFISWDLKHSIKKWSIDVGWASTWVKIVNEWFAATIYLWTLVSPLVMKHWNASAVDVQDAV